MDMQNDNEPIAKQMFGNVSRLKFQLGAVIFLLALYLVSKTF